MRRWKEMSCLIVLIFSLLSAKSQQFEANNNVGKERRHHWKAKWIANPVGPQCDYNVQLFRRSFELREVPEQLMAYVSADNRYELYVNNNRIGLGPARGDLLNWRYETYNIAPYLKSGINIIAARVVNFGAFAPISQISVQTGFICQLGEYDQAEIYTSDGNWKVIQDQSTEPVLFEMEVAGYYAAGALDSFRCDKYLWNWKEIDYDDSSWGNPFVVNNGKNHGAINNSHWYLIKRDIPALEEKTDRLKSIRKCNNIKVDNSFLHGEAPITIPANSKISVLIDNEIETVGYPQIYFEGGKDALIKISYAESLYEKNETKGNRNEIENKIFIGYHDVIVPDGGKNRVFRPLWWRTFRYIQLEVETREQPLIINDMVNVFTAYPFKCQASFNNGNDKMAKLWDMCWQTSRLCANETYMDCPYYEQLNYIGDTRIQSLISVYLAGDDRLMRNAMLQFESSRNYMGITQSRYPTKTSLLIPAYSLFLNSMVYDHLMHQNDPAFDKKFLLGMRSTLEFFEQYLNQDGVLENLDWWQFTDWAVGFERGIPPGTEDNVAANLSVQYLYAIINSVKVFEYFGLTVEANKWQAIGEKLKTALLEQCFSYEKGLFAETPSLQQFSQHTNIMAILCDVVPDETQHKMMASILADTSLIQTTLYFKYYLFKAMKKTGFGENFENELSVWYSMIDRGYSTCGETGQEHHDRSDCHAWSASPALFYLDLVCGIEPVKPGFQEVLIKPSLGSSKNITASMPHPKGEINIELSKIKEGIIGKVILPKSTTGTFVYGSIKQSLFEGINKIEIKGNQ